MYDLLEEYLEKNEVYSFGEVELLSYEEDGHKCKVYYKRLEDDYRGDTEVSLWDVMVYVNGKK